MIILHALMFFAGRTVFFCALLAFLVCLLCLLHEVYVKVVSLNSKGKVLERAIMEL